VSLHFVQWENDVPHTVANVASDKSFNGNNKESGFYSFFDWHVVRSKKSRLGSNTTCRAIDGLHNLICGYSPEFECFVGLRVFTMRQKVVSGI
jgi:hypothetical protein